ncbi:hypothetical protein BASA81_009643 [Batrachochytrium salamandrivorans]|nr:hypothetical protein BASA81_009643 [Batrachochytrium salamandrivorans]
MKLISFAVISFLAIAVSAYPHQNPDEQDFEGSQDASFQSAEQPQGVTTQVLLENQGTIDQSEPEPQSATVQGLQEPQGATVQGLQEPQGATVQSEQQHQGAIDQSEPENPQQSLQDMLDKLLKEYEEKQAETDRLQQEIDRLEEEMLNIESRANTFDGPGVMSLFREFIAKNGVLVRARASKETLEREMEATMVKHSEIARRWPH